MSEEFNDGGPAFPLPNSATVGDYRTGMSLRAYAAIKLCVPESGICWLDDMIREAQRGKFVEQTLSGILANPCGEAGNWEKAADDAHKKAAVAMLKARKEGSK